MVKVRAKIFYLSNYDRENWGPMVYAHDTDTGFDIRACNSHNVIIEPGQRVVIPAGFKILPDIGFALQVRARSGNSLKLGLALANGVGTIDYGYLGEVGVIVVNLSNEPIVIEPGMKIAQGVVEPLYQFDFEEVDSEDELGTTLRGEGGFGSTGVK